MPCKQSHQLTKKEANVTRARTCIGDLGSTAGLDRSNRDRARIETLIIYTRWYSGNIGPMLINANQEMNPYC